MRTPRVVPKATLDLQATAADPANSVWVSANAGSGKTHVLSMRVVRLLLQGADPSKILCLTYTRAAAANMSNRVFENLSRWAMLDEASLADQMEALEGRRPDAGKVGAARRLFAEALETPGGLKIQTIHAFCEAILHQFPLEANIAAQFQLLDSGMEAVLVETARRELITGAVAAKNPELEAAFATVLERAGDFGLNTLLGEIVAQRDGLGRFIDAISDGSTGFDALFTEFGFAHDASAENIAGSLWPDTYFNRVFADDFAGKARSAGKINAQGFAQGLLEACGHSDGLKRFECLKKTFLTTAGVPRQPGPIASNGIRDHFPGFAEAFQRTAQTVKDACDRIALLRMLEGTRAALTVADVLLGRYEALKASRGFLDFNDLITRTVRLLARQDAGPWVHYKLDKGIDHILLDEAQDTSPDQWSVVTRLAEEFFAGSGARDEVERTIFAVGDEKQSIYSFQGAMPEVFDETGRRFRQKVTAVDRKFEKVGLTYSFRSTEDVLAAVDHVFSVEDARRGLTRDPEPIEHKAIRAEAPGYVEVWPSVAAEAVEEPDDWTQAIDHASAPAVRVAESVAETIALWLKQGERLESSGRKLGPGDVMVLVRKRDRFVHALSRSLKNRDIPVAGADRLRLPAHIGVQDLIALGRFLLQPEDDLSLAALLRSPIFGQSETALFELAAGRDRGVSLARSLRGSAENDATLSGIVDQLDAWANDAAFKPVFEFYGGVLGRDGVRERMIARLGPEAGDVLDEFLSFCLAEERAGSRGLEAFLSTLESAGPEIKREMDQRRDEIRIMTVHAAKGLEAPVVFLVDSGGASFHPAHLPRLIPIESQTGAWTGKGYLWRSASEVANPLSQAAEARARERADDEYRRLLYVGMTRAEDRLIVCGYHGKRPPPGNTWHGLVTRALAVVPGIEEREPAAGGDVVRRFRVPKPSPDAPEEEPARPVRAAVPKPSFRPLPATEDLPRALSPSGASLLIEDAPETAPGSRSPVLESERPSFAILRGLAIHKMLQMLPEMATEERKGAAERYLERVGVDWAASERKGALQSVLGILESTGFAAVFAPGISRAEVAVTGSLMVRGKPRLISGKIDRLAVTPDVVLIVDYKTNRPAPASLEEVPFAYVTQLALYRALLQPLYPDRRVAAALLFTEAPRLIDLPEAAMENALARLTGE